MTVVARAREIAVPAGTLTLYAVTVFTSASLLFVVEPMVAKMLLPFVGGAPAVWTTSLLFFQAVLLAGYAYAHYAATRFAPRIQAMAQVLLLLVALVSLPIGFGGVGRPPSGPNPAGWLLLVMLTRVGLPFFCLSTLSPLLQSWFSRTGHRDAGDPYFLYLTSNVGSIGALLAYPAVMERYLGLGAQSRLWAVAYLALLVMVAAAGTRLATQATGPATPGRAAPTDPIGALPRAGHLDLRRLARWVALATVPSLWMLGMTAYFTTRIRPVPLLWVIPLVLYLLSFAVVFARRPPRVQRLAPAYPFLAVTVLGLTLFGGDSVPFPVAAAVHFGAFFVGALLCHGQLAADRPPARHLTSFYLALSAGGALGGLLGAIVAPLFLPDLFEYQLAIVAGGLLVPAASLTARWRSDATRALVFAGAIAAVSVTLLVAGLPERLSHGPALGGGTAAVVVRMLLALGLPAVAAVHFSRRPVGLFVALATVFCLSLLPLGSEPAPLYQGRDFFGVHRVVGVGGGLHVYRNGGTVHGLQFSDARRRDLPAGYYEPSGPVGDMLGRPLPAGATIAVIGMGAGAMSCYHRADQAWTFYEVDPEVVRIARDPRLFTYLHDCAPDARVLLGDGRLEITRAAPSSYDFIAVDAFSGDSPPLHLLTREALATYMAKLRPGGLLALHISNSFLDFRSVLGATGASLGLHVYERIDTGVTPAQAADGKIASDWVVVARDPADAAPVTARPGWVPVPALAGAPVWTDDYTNLLSVLRLF